MDILHVYVIQVATIPKDITLAFLPGLTVISNLLAVMECTIEDMNGGCPIRFNSPPVPRLVALPALSKVYRLQSLTIMSSALKDMMSFKAFTCPPTDIALVSNRHLATLHGLDSVGPWTKDPDGPFITAAVNKLPTPGTVSALKTMALCDESGLSGLSRRNPIAIMVSSCNIPLEVRPICPYHTAVGPHARTDMFIKGVHLPRWGVHQTRHG